VLVHEEHRQPDTWPSLTTFGRSNQPPRKAQCSFDEEQARTRRRGGKTIISTAFVDNPVHKWPRQLPYSNIWNCFDRFA
jgi:hypothetical protein